jgi:hypothetical protein
VVRDFVRPGVRDCYNDALRSFGHFEGTVHLAIHVAPDGSVDDVPMTGVETLPQSLVACISSVARSAKFEPPGGSGATIGTSFNLEDRR